MTEASLRDSVHKNKAYGVTYKQEVVIVVSIFYISHLIRDFQLKLYLKPRALNNDIIADFFSTDELEDLYPVYLHSKYKCASSLKN